MIPAEIRKYLSDRRVQFHELTHAHRATAQDTASVAHIAGKRFAKTLVLKHQGKFTLVVIPADEHVDLQELGEVLGGRVELAREEEFTPLFAHCEAGAMPPLGGLYGLPVLADSCLASQQTIAVNGGTHSDVIEIDWDQFIALEHPRVVEHVKPRRPASTTRDEQTEGEDTMATINNGVIARKIYDDFNKHDLEALAGACAEDVKYTDMVSGRTYEGPMGFRAASERWLSAFPDAKVEILNQVVTDDLVVTEFVGRGTQSGALADPTGGSIPPTGKKAEVSCCEIFRLRDGKIVSGRLYYDSLTLLRQLGVAPGLAPERPAEPAQPQP